MSGRPSRSLLPLLPGVLALAACSEGTQFSLRYAPAATGFDGSLAFLGVFRGGRLDPQGLEAITPALATRFPLAGCQAAFGRSLERQDNALFLKVDRLARAEGVTESVVELVAPSTSAHTLVVFSIHDPVGLAASPSSQRLRPKRYPVKGRAAPVLPLEVSASFYSVADRRWLGKLTMTYGGKEFDEALALFGKRFAGAVAGARCEGFHFQRQEP